MAPEEIYRRILNIQRKLDALVTEIGRYQRDLEHLRALEEMKSGGKTSDLPLSTVLKKLSDSGQE